MQYNLNYLKLFNITRINELYFNTVNKVYKKMSINRVTKNLLSLVL